MKKDFNINLKKIILYFKKKKLSSFCLSIYFLENIIKFSDFSGCYLDINFNYVLLESIASDLRRSKKKELSIIDGIVISIKDNIITKSLQTTASSRILEGFIPNYNSTVIEKMKILGVIILGKLNSDEFGMGSTNENSGYKICKNSRNYLYSPGGSSGGCSSSIVSNLSLLSLGSDTGGSVRLPSSYLNCLGFKPTYGVISRFGLISFSDSLDTIGIICKSVFDIFIILKFIYGIDNNDLNTINKNIVFGDNINNFKILFPLNYINFFSKNVLKNSFLSIISKIKEIKNIKVFYSAFPFYLFFIYIYYINSSVEAYSNLSRYGNNQFGKVLCLNNSNFFKNRSNYFGREVKKRILIGNYFLINKDGNKTYKKSFFLKNILFNFFLNLFKKIDFIILPSIIDIQLLLGEKSSKNCVYFQDSFTVISSICGFPTISLNLNNYFSFENSFSFQILGNLCSDYKLLKFCSYIRKKDIFNF